MGHLDLGVVPVNHRQERIGEKAGLDIDGVVELRTWSAATLRTEIEDWPRLSDAEKAQALREAELNRYRTSNIALNGLLEYIPASLAPGESVSATVSHLGLGTGTTDPDPSNTALNEEVYRIGVGEADTDGTDLLVSTFLSQTEANGYTITEVGLVGGRSESAPLLTHAVLDTADQIEKNTDMVVTINYVLSFQRPS